MKILMYTDVHWCSYSSIVRSRGTKYSTRLENLIKSVSWAECLSKELNCDRVICLGDFFDKPELNCEELTALREVKWNKDIPHYFVVGNHESSVNGLRYNSTKALEDENFKIVDSPECNEWGGRDFLFLPYITESDRKPLKEYLHYFGDTYNPDNLIIFSHNDIAGIQMGPVVSKDGFGIDDIESSCKLFLNGHLHNGGKITSKIINIGNLTGQNFSEDAEKYSHCAFVLDTDTMELTAYENPYAFNFYKLELTEDCRAFNLKDNAVLCVKCPEKLFEEVKNNISKATEIVDYRVVVDYTKPEVLDESGISSEIISDIDYLEKFSTFIKHNIGTDEIVCDELAHIVGVK